MNSGSFLQRRRVLLAFGAMAVLAGHGAAWFIVTGQIMAAVPAALGNAPAYGWTIEAGPPARAGWPWAAVVHLPDVTAYSMAAPLRWTAARLDLTVLPQDIGALRVSPVGAQTVQAGGGEPIAVMARQTTLRVPFAQDMPTTLEVLDLDAPGLRAGRLAATLTPLDAQVTATSVRQSPPLPRPFDGRMTLSARLTLNHPIPFGASAAAAASAWRSAGGEAAVPELDLLWGPLHATGSARIWLDPALQPVAQARVQVAGAAELVDAAVGAGVLAPGPASAVRAVLGLLSLAAKGGPLTLPIDLTDHVLTVARFPLARLPPLDWNRP